MSIDRILSELRDERDRMDRAILALESGVRGREHLNGSRVTGRRVRHMSAEARRRISAMMKKRWAERKKRVKAT